MRWQSQVFLERIGRHGDYEEREWELRTEARRGVGKLGVTQICAKASSSENFME